MPPFRSSQIRLIQNAASSTRASARQILAHRAPPAPFPVVPTCPSPTCSCTPMPQGLEIDYSKSLNGTMAPYSQHVVVFTGQKDWKSKIEDEYSTGNWGRVLAGLKTVFGRGGEFHDPYKNVLISASSWQPASEAGEGTCEAMVFPGFVHNRFPVQKHNQFDEQAVKKFCKDLRDRNLDTNTSNSAEDALPARSLEYPTIMICSHGGRDNRCGVLGPILHEEFRRVLSRRSWTELSVASESNKHKLDLGKVNIGMISHMGGHKWAGNVIVYLPTKWRISSQREGGEGEQLRSPLAGTGIWYGRVEPRHVEGIIDETLVSGRVIQELFRGGIDRTSHVLRIP